MKHSWENEFLKKQWKIKIKYINWNYIERMRIVKIYNNDLIRKKERKKERKKIYLSLKEKERSRRKKERKKQKCVWG